MIALVVVPALVKLCLSRRYHLTDQIDRRRLPLGARGLDRPRAHEHGAIKAALLWAQPAGYFVGAAVGKVARLRAKRVPTWQKYVGRLRGGHGVLKAHLIVSMFQIVALLQGVIEWPSYVAWTLNGHFANLNIDASIFACAFDSSFYRRLVFWTVGMLVLITSLPSSRSRCRGSSAGGSHASGASARRRRGRLGARTCALACRRTCRAVGRAGGSPARPRAACAFRSRGGAGRRRRRRGGAGGGDVEMEELRQSTSRRRRSGAV